MDKHIVEAYVFQSDLKQTIYYTQGTDALPILFLFKDYDIPAGTSVGIYVEKPSKKGVQSTSATLNVDENSILVDMDKQMVAEIGTAYMQLQLTKGGKELFAFVQPICVERSATPIVSENGMPFLDEAIEKMNEATEDTKAAAEDAREVAADMQQKAANGTFSASVRVGETIIVESGESAEVTNSGTAKDAVLDFKIPRGPQGLSGISASTQGMFTVYVDEATGHLHVEFPDETEPPPLTLRADGHLIYSTS